MAGGAEPAVVADGEADELARLREQLERERKRSSSYAAEIRKLKEHQLETQQRVEQEEEFMTNTLMKRLEQLKVEKQAIVAQVEQEEEFLTNSLQRRLDAVNREKFQLEQQLEAEQEFMVNKLQKQVNSLAKEKTALAREREDLKKQVTALCAQRDRLAHEKVDLENYFEAEEEGIVLKLQKQIETLKFQKRSLERRIAHSESDASASEDEGSARSREGRPRWGGAGNVQRRLSGSVERNGDPSSLRTSFDMSPHMRLATPPDRRELATPPSGAL